MAESDSRRFAGQIFIWSGLLSRNLYGWQQGMRKVGSAIGDATFIPSKRTGSGYDWIDEVTEAIIANGHERVLLIGHSNGVYAITEVARRLRTGEVVCTLISFDQTLKDCPKLGANVDRAIDLWAGLDKLEAGRNFTGKLRLYDFSPDSHIGITHDTAALQIAINFGRAWKHEWEPTG